VKASAGTQKGGNKKLKGGKGGAGGAGGGAGKQQGAGSEPEGGWKDMKVNTSVYIAGLPDDVTLEELHEAVSKYGLVKEDEAQRPKIKLYRCAIMAAWSCDGNQ
jgi:hypothetical protein